MRRAIGIAVVAAAAAIAGCAQNRSESGGPTVERNYQVGGFERIDLAGAYDVEVRTGAAPSVQARGPEKAIERLVVEVRGDRLLIHPRKRSGLNLGWTSHGKVDLIVTVPTLRAIELAGSGDIRVNEVRGDSFAGEVAGSGNLAVDRVDVQQLKLGIAGSGEAVARQGRARTVEYSIAGSGGIDAGGIAAETAAVSIAGSGDVRANASGTAKVDIAGSGNVDMSGGAKCTVSKAGSGDVRCS